MAKTPANAKGPSAKDDKKPGTALARPRGTAVAPAALMDEMVGDAGKGLATGANAYAIPFLGILEPLSPQLQRNNAAYVKGAEQGQVINSVTGEIFECAEDKEGSGILVVPCAYTCKSIEWKPNRGGLVKIHDENTPLWRQTVRNDKNQDVLPNGNLLVLTAHHYILQLHYDEDVLKKVDQAVIAMSSTRYKCSKRWNTLIAGIEQDTPNGPVILPSFASVWRLQSIAQQDGDKSWCIWKTTHEKLVDDITVYRRAKTFSQSVEKGEVEAKPLEGDTIVVGEAAAQGAAQHI